MFSMKRKRNWPVIWCASFRIIWFIQSSVKCVFTYILLSLYIETVRANGRHGINFSQCQSPGNIIFFVTRYVDTVCVVVRRRWNHHTCSFCSFFQEEIFIAMDRSEVERRLRSFYQPITYFAESDIERQKRLHQVSSMLIRVETHSDFTTKALLYAKNSICR